MKIEWVFYHDDCGFCHRWVRLVVKVAPIPPVGSRYVTVNTGSQLFPLVFTE